MTPEERAAQIVAIATSPVASREYVGKAIAQSIRDAITEEREAWISVVDEFRVDLGRKMADEIIDEVRKKWKWR